MGLCARPAPDLRAPRASTTHPTPPAIAGNRPNAASPPTRTPPPLHRTGATSRYPKSTTPPVSSGYVGYEHAWSPAFTTAVTFGVVDVNNLDIQPEDAFHQTQRASINLMWNPVPFMDLVVEYLAGTRFNKNGQRASSSQIQSGWTLRF